MMQSRFSETLHPTATKNQVPCFFMQGFSGWKSVFEHQRNNNPQ
jgi:hypothetical protein